MLLIMPSDSIPPERHSKSDNPRSKHSQVGLSNEGTPR